ncbi:transport integral membrane protein [Streptomyces camponoticapitis]|uniref:Transport integral membrane protein n=1 Tax=Streptomyces camponoticapitis TaxID=1616125 RepID=A0ABQ2E0T4_9ACTN|nr:copper resistance protein CopC [Streptomyces camponoticapitis]GGJ82948.1 transport integral membrane protein [Streptomyces camponoticapitis]
MTATAPRFGTRLIRLLLVTGVLIVGLLGALSGTASAHAALTGSDPKDGAVVDVAPKDVTLTFSEQIAMGDDSIRVLDPTSKRVDVAKMRDLSEGGTVRYAVDLKTGLPDGTYTVAWQAVSADSHPVSGAFTFSVGAPSKTTATVPDQEAGGGVVGLLYDTVRYISYAGFVALVGGAAFVLACWQRGASVRPLQRLVVGGWVTLTAATLVLLLLRTPYTGSGKLGDAFDLGGLTDVLDTKTGAALVSRLLLLGAAALFIAVLFGAYAKRVTEAEAGTEAGTESGDAAGTGADAGKAKADLTFGLGLGGTVVAAGIAGTWALSEHASTGIQTGLAMPLDVLHLLAVATWLGGLVSLLIALYRTPDIERAAVQRFSRIAFGSVVVLAVTGLYQAWRQVGSWSALTDTSYGKLLLVKVALIAVLLGAAWFSRRWTGLLGERARTEAEAGVEAAAEAGVETEAEADAEDDAEAETETETGPDPERAAQLARQQTALATARKKRVRDADTERSGLRRSVLTEACIALVVLAVTTALTGTEPGRTEAKEVGRSGTQASAPAAPAGPISLTEPFDTGGVKGKGTLRLTLDPASPGANLMHVWVDGPDGKPMDVPEVKVSYTLRSEQIGPLPVVPERLAAGHWSSGNVQIPMPGDWHLQVTVRTSDIDQTTIEKNVKIG